MSGFTFLSAVTPDQNLQKIGFTGVVLLGIALIGTITAGNISTKEKQEALIVPTKFSLISFFDTFFEFFLNFHDSVAGKHNRKFASLSATVFIIILTLNLLGLIPGLITGTTSVVTTLSLAILVFLVFNYYGIREQGFIQYIKHFAGPVWWLAPLLFPLEIFSTCLRILTLNLRLYWNMTADHVVLGIFTDLTHYVFPVVFYLLGTFVCFMQAFVFTTLTMVYIFLAVNHSEEEHH